MFLFRLEHAGGEPADPPTMRSAVPNWQAGDQIALGRGRSLRVVAVLTTTPTSRRCWSSRSVLKERLALSHRPG